LTNGDGVTEKVTGNDNDIERNGGNNLARNVGEAE
jgi:hypothetical protein